MAVIKQEFRYDPDRETPTVINHVDYAPTLRQAELQRNLDPYLDKQKNFRRLCTIPVAAFCDPTDLELRFFKMNVGKDDVEAKKWLRRWIALHPKFQTAEKI